MRQLILIALILLGTSTDCLRSADDAAGLHSVIYTPSRPKESDRQWPIYEDSLVIIVGVNYGTEDAKSDPGLFVFRKVNSDWVRIDRISTRNALLGRNPTFEEAKEAGKGPPSIGWDFRPLAHQLYVCLPLQFAGFLFFPDRVERDDEAGEYVLRFNSTWEIEGVETVLRFSVEELVGAGGYARTRCLWNEMKNESTAKTAPVISGSTPTANSPE
jgi:hypothetical protein